MVKNSKEANKAVEIKYIAFIIVVISIVLLAIFYKKDVKVTMPELIIEPNNDWNQRVIVKITKDSVSKDKIVGYKYCINNKQNEDNCDWKLTLTKNFEVYQNGVNYVFVKGIDEKDNLSNAVMKTIRIDNDAPNISAVNINNKTENEISVSVNAFDSLTSIKYYYSVNNGEFVEGDNVFSFKDLTPKTKYEIRVKVVDEVGNEKIVGMEETTN